MMLLLLMCGMCEVRRASVVAPSGNKHSLIGKLIHVYPYQMFVILDFIVDLKLNHILIHLNPYPSAGSEVELPK